MQSDQDSAKHCSILDVVTLSPTNYTMFSYSCFLMGISIVNCKENLRFVAEHQKFVTEQLQKIAKLLHTTTSFSIVL